MPDNNSIAQLYGIVNTLYSCNGSKVGGIRHALILRLTTLSLPAARLSSRAATICNAVPTSFVYRLWLYPDSNDPPIALCPNNADTTCGATPKSPANVAHVRLSEWGVTSNLTRFLTQFVHRGQLSKRAFR